MNFFTPPLIKPEHRHALTYLGDNVYAEIIANDTIKVTVDYGMESMQSAAIILRPDVYAALVRYAERRTFDVLI